jgi:hypothetical protein
LPQLNGLALDAALLVSARRRRLGLLIRSYWVETEKIKDSRSSFDFAQDDNFVAMQSFWAGSID